MAKIRTERSIPHTKEHIKAIREIARFYDVQIKIRYGDNPDATVWLESELIDLVFTKDTSISNVFSAFFHELGHIYCKYHRIYPYYNLGWDPHFFNKKERSYMLATAARAELHNEKIAKMLMSWHLPKVPFIAGYTKSSMKKYFAKEIKKGLREMFKIIDLKKKACHHNK